MNGPNDLDDGWAELARELGLEGDRPFPPAAPDHPAADLHPPEDPAPVAAEEEFGDDPADEATPADEGIAYAESEAEAEGDDELDDEGEDVDGEAVPGEPGEPKKKRRRRRRRKKKPGEGAVPVAAPAGEELADEPAASAEPDDLDEPALPPDGLVEEEGATPAATRELIANWDVPSWETIVGTMLFRPQGR